ncbi:MAG: hypothetical protein MI700_11695 [Balneolales bacterium]|nr:hypothetical protein [Balneolales bacterium]
MKTLKSLSSIFVLTLVFATAAFAQSDNANVAATATITATMTLNATDVAFGEVPTGTAASMNVSGVVTGGTGGTPAAGTLTIPGTVATGTIGLSWTADGTSGDPAVLTNVAGTGSITFTPSLDITSGATATNIGNDASFVHTTATATVITVYGALSSATEAGAYSTGNTNGYPLVFTATFE